MKFPSTVVGVLLGMSASSAAPSEFVVRSADAVDGTLPPIHFADVMGCTGQNVSPRISWTGAPDGTRSFVVTIFDQDAPTGSGWWHWVVTNIPATTSDLPRGASMNPDKLPKGAIETNTDAGQPGYGGPCPPVGQSHRYLVTVNALKTDKLDLPPNATAALVGMLVNMNSLGKASVTLTAGR